MANIAWAITGAGAFLFETLDVMERVSTRYVLSCYLSEAGERVIRVYGLFERLEKIYTNKYYNELILESDQKPAFPLTGRFFRGGYKALIVSPASSNTIAKIAMGIADSLVTNAVSQAEKASIPVLIVPSDQKGKRITRLPPIIERGICQKHLGINCRECPILNICPFGAIIEVEGIPKIDLSKCEGCKSCIDKCPYGAISFGQEIETRVRKIDLDNVRKLRKNKNFTVLKTPEEVPDALEKVLKAYG